MTATHVLARTALCGIAASMLLQCAQVRVRLSVGQATVTEQPFYVRVLPGSPSSTVQHLQDTSRSARGLSPDTWTGNAGAGKPASATFALLYPDDSAAAPRPIHVMWADLISHSDADTAARLSKDALDEDGRPAVRVLLGKDEPHGFTFTVDQLLREKAMWLPAYDVFITLADQPVSFAQYQAALQPFKGKRILDTIPKEPEATYQEYASKWPDMGSPDYVHPHQVAPGHIICLSWDSAIPKFGIDRGAGVWNDYGNPDHFRFWFGFGDFTQGILKSWKSQRLDSGLPIVTTTLEQNGVRYEVEQFAYPLNGPPGGRNGDIKMILLQKVRITNLQDSLQVVPVSMTQRRLLPIETGANIEMVNASNGVEFRDKARKKVLLALQGAETIPEWHETLDYDREDKRVAGSVRLDLTLAETLPPFQSREFIVKVPSPMTDPDSAGVLASLDYAQARAETRRFWLDWVSRGAQVQVPEAAVNDMFRSSLWHALRLPRRHGGEGYNTVIDLPYSNFAYDQTGIPWPGVQSIYVDYMLYELRGYSSVALEELLQQFRSNQDEDGHVSGFANWTMYTPAMLYATGQYYLLSHDKRGFDLLLPYALKALAWCEHESKRAQARHDFPGLIDGPLNDGTGEGTWAINQAYMYAGLDRFGTALEQFGDSHARAALEQAQRIARAVQTGFEQAASSAPIVQLRDHTWQPFVPSDVQRPRRLMEIWYPTDVDTGPLHLLRLKALSAESRLANFLLNDHEDNLFLKGWGAANEPVYRPQGLAYLYRDDPAAAIRTFYSQMACAFSHTVFEPVEHRWMHGQYFGPPSTDGSWLELLRDLLVRETDDQTLLIGQATPRRWLADGEKIDGSRIPTYFGEVSFHIDSHSQSGTIRANIDLPLSRRPAVLLVRLRHPDAKPIRSVLVNGQPWRDFDLKKEWIKIERPAQAHYEIAASY